MFPTGRGSDVLGNRKMKKMQPNLQWISECWEWGKNYDRDDDADDVVDVVVVAIVVDAYDVDDDVDGVCFLWSALLL